MSEKLCALRKIGGGTLKETTLWTNSSPTSTFGYQVITLSQSYLDFKYVKLKWKRATSVDAYLEMLIDTTILANGGGYTVASTNNITWGSTTDDRQSVVRYMVAISGTSIEISNGLYVGKSGTNNYMALPIEIVGLK